jgi:hypothetical protein
LSNGKNSSKKGTKSHSLRIMETPWHSYRFRFGVLSQQCRANQFADFDTVITHFRI